jgi:hypothetical protein
MEMASLQEMPINGPLHRCSGRYKAVASLQRSARFMRVRARYKSVASLQEICTCKFGTTVLLITAVTPRWSGRSDRPSAEALDDAHQGARIATGGVWPLAS